MENPQQQLQENAEAEGMDICHFCRRQSLGVIKYGAITICADCLTAADADSKKAAKQKQDKEAAEEEQKETYRKEQEAEQAHRATQQEVARINDAQRGMQDIRVPTDSGLAAWRARRAAEDADPSTPLVPNLTQTSALADDWDDSAPR